MGARNVGAERGAGVALSGYVAAFAHARRHAWMVKTARILWLALGLASLAAPALAQTTCAPTPALPDTVRRTEYAGVSASTGPFNVNFQLYGDGTDFGAWLSVWVNGKALTAVTDYTVTSPSGPLANLCRPIADAQVTFTAAQTGTIEIEGSRRPRRASQFSENAGVPARSINQVLSDMEAQLRERWDREGRLLRTAPGETLSVLPPAASRANGLLGFSGTGDVAVVNPGAGGGGTMVGPNSTTVGQFVIWNSTNGTLTAGTPYFLGRPWADVRAFGAVGDNVVDDTAAIQSAITAAAGGIVFFSPGNYKITTTLNITNPGTCLIGASVSSTNLLGATDFTMISFAANTAYSCLEKIGVYGYRVSTATNPTVLIGANALVNMRDCLINGGVFGLRTAGTDGMIENCAIAGWGTTGGNVDSTGANWYVRDKLDQGSVTVSFGFHQGISPALAENHFEQTDFSGNFSVSSLAVDDGGTSRAITIISGGVFSSPIRIDNAKFTSLIGAELGSTTLVNTAGPLSVVGSFAFSATTATGAGARSCAGNINITC